MAGEAPAAGRAGLHSSGSVLAESAGSVVASVQKGGISGPDLCQRRRDRESSADCNPATQLQSEAVGVGPSAEAPKASAAFLCLPSLRNVALGSSLPLSFREFILSDARNSFCRMLVNKGNPSPWSRHHPPYPQGNNLRVFLRNLYHTVM